MCTVDVLFFYLFSTLFLSRSQFTIENCHFIPCSFYYTKHISCTFRDKMQKFQFGGGIRKILLRKDCQNSPNVWSILILYIYNVNCTSDIPPLFNTFIWCRGMHYAWYALQIWTMISKRQFYQTLCVTKQCPVSTVIIQIFAALLLAYPIRILALPPSSCLMDQ